MGIIQPFSIKKFDHEPKKPKAAHTHKTHSLSSDLKIITRKEPPIQIINILRPRRPVDLVIQQNITAIPTDRASQPAVRKGTLRLRAQPDILGRVSREIGAIDPEAEEGVGEGGRVVDKDLGDVDVADEGFVEGG